MAAHMSTGLNMSLAITDDFDSMASYDRQGRCAVAETLLTSTPKAASAITSWAKRAAAVVPSGRTRERGTDVGLTGREDGGIRFQGERSAESI